MMPVLHLLLLFCWAICIQTTALASTEPLSLKQHQDGVPEIKAGFDQKLFDLAHTVFLANANPYEALSVAERALKSRPEDVVWRKKAAQDAEWAGKPAQALQHWLVLARRNDHDATAEALRISRALQELPLRKQLLEQLLASPLADEAHLREYISVAEGMGAPQDAYAVLLSSKISAVDPAWLLTERARLAESLGQIDEALGTWQQRAEIRPLNTEEALLVASLWYDRKQNGQAWQVLRQGAEHAAHDATEFWRTYADLAWALGETGEAARAADILLATDAATEADLQRMLELFRESNPEKVYAYALQGWQRFHRPQFWNSLVDSGLRLGRIQELDQAIGNLNLEQRTTLAADSSAWISLSRVYHAAGNLQSGLTAARVATRLAPHDSDILTYYLWLLIDSRQISELRLLISRSKDTLIDLPGMQEPLAAATFLLGETQEALRLYLVLLPERQKDPLWLVAFADVLEQAGRQDTAWRVRQWALHLLDSQISKERTADTALQLVRAQLLLNISPGDRLVEQIRRLVAVTERTVDKELALSLLMATGQPDLARLWYWRLFTKTMLRPDGLRLSLALEDNDRAVLAEFLENKRDRLPLHDAIEAAQRTGLHPLAEELAWQRYQVTPDDYLLAERVRQLFEDRPGYVDLDVSLHDQSGVGWVESRLTVAQPLTRRFSFKAEVAERHYSLLNNGALRWLPDNDLAGVLTISRQHERGNLTVSLGFLHSELGSHGMVSAEGSWQPWSRLQLRAGAESGVRGEETAALAVGGARDRIRLAAAGTLTTDTTLTFELTTAKFYDHERYYLGGGNSLMCELRHQLTHSWPDYGIRFFTGYSRHRADGIVSVQTAALIPAGTAASASFFVPESYGYFGAGLFIGQSARQGYTRNLKPYAELDAIWNSNSGYGFSYGLGMATTIFGLDQLQLGLIQGSGQFGATDLSTIIRLKYRYLF